MKQRLGTLFKIARRQIIVCALVMIVISFLLFIYLGSRPPALSSAEISTRNSSISLRTILKDPINAPFTVPQHFAVKLKPLSVSADRITAVLFGLLTLICFFGIVNFWFGSTSAVVSTVIFATSSWFLHTARLGTPDVLLFVVVALIGCALWLKHTLKRNAVMIVCALALGIALYIPGAIWFILAGILWQRFTIKHEFKRTKKLTKVVAAILLILLLIPLAWAIAHKLSIVWAVLGLPSHWPAPIQIFRNLYHIPLDLFFRTSFDPVHWLGQLPILDIFADVMFILGLYSFWKHRSLERSTQLFGSILLGIILISLGGPVNITLIIPLIYIIIGVGVLFMWDQWSKIFPYNPVARSVGLALMAIAIFVSCNYQIQRYFTAWPADPTTQAVFSQKPTDI